MPMHAFGQGRAESTQTWMNGAALEDMDEGWRWKNSWGVEGRGAGENGGLTCVPCIAEGTAPVIL